MKRFISFYINNRKKGGDYMDDEEELSLPKGVKILREEDLSDTDKAILEELRQEYGIELSTGDMPTELMPDLSPEEETEIKKALSV